MLDSIEEFAYLYDIIIGLQILNSIQDGNEIYTLLNKARWKDALNSRYNGLFRHYNIRFNKYEVWSDKYHYVQRQFCWKEILTLEVL